MTSCSCIDGVEVYAGRDYTLVFNLTKSTPVPSTPYDLTGAKIWFSMKDETNDADSDAVIYKRSTLAGGDSTEIEITDAPGGVCNVYIVPDDTKDLSEGDFWFDLVVENNSGKKMQAVAPSRFHVNYTVTKADTP